MYSIYKILHSVYAMSPLCLCFVVYDDVSAPTTNQSGLKYIYRATSMYYLYLFVYRTLYFNTPPLLLIFIIPFLE